MKRYNLINDLLGWFCFLVAAVTYLLTVEPTASFWDCPEFISQGAKLEVGHPPGNPIFMLAARFFVNFASGDVERVALAVNSMSALLSAGTILLLFWTITHLVKRLIVKDDEQEIPLTKLIVIMASGLCGSLAFTWSDTFWFSAVEGEVYAFSSFCTALVFWLILKWENRADEPHSDRYLLLIAYVIGISIAVHLLNLLCIPAIVLVVYYRKFKNTTAKGSLIALGISFVIVALILFGLVPGFIEIAQYFELFFVNVLGMGYNTGVLFYVVLLVGVMIWCVSALYHQKSVKQMRWSFFATVVLSGIPFIGDSWIIPVVIIGALFWWLFFGKKLPVRILNIAALSIMVIFVGYSSYALLLIRSAANPPMNQNAPDNVFALGSYLNREQYGEAPLLYGQQFSSLPIYIVDNNLSQRVKVDKGHNIYSKIAKGNPDDPDKYVVTGTKDSYDWTPKTIFPRMYSRSGQHPQSYLDWIGATEADLSTREVSPFYFDDGEVFSYGGQPYTTQVKFPTMAQNLRYFIVYQLNHMYWRYFMWNFAGRQNDLQGNGEVNRGNWISGIPFIDNLRLGDQSLLPYDYGEGNKGHNVFYMLPLILGLIGLLWQAFYSKRGIEQFWVVFFLFFMTGIAIVLYLNQPPMQPRERDYAFAGSFYAFSLWIGIGVAAIAELIGRYGEKKNKGKSTNLVATVVASVIALAVPLQMVSQTWDDHDRSGRFAARDFGMNYLSSLAPNAVIFTNGDNDTFPLWYAQEVENYRTDVRVVNLSYLTTDWYANQMKMPTDGAMAIDMLAKPTDYAYDRLQFNYFSEDSVAASTPVNALASLAELYRQSPEKAEDGSNWKYTNMYIPVDVEQAVAAGIIAPEEASAASDNIIVDLSKDPGHGASLSSVLSLDILATSAKNGWNRPVYFAMTVPDTYYLGLSPYMRNTGLTYQVTPIYDNQEYGPGVDTDRMYDNVMNRFRWAGIPEAVEKGKPLYLDETISRMVVTHRSALIDLASALFNEGIGALDSVDEGKVEAADTAAVKTWAADRFAKALDVINLCEEKLPAAASPYGVQIGEQIAMVYLKLGEILKRDDLNAKGLDILHGEIMKYAAIEKYVNNLKRTPWQYNTLSRTDRYAPAYLVRMISDYYSGGGNLDKLSEELAVAGYDISHLLEENAD